MFFVGLFTGIVPLSANSGLRRPSDTKASGLFCLPTVRIQLESRAEGGGVLFLRHTVGWIVPLWLSTRDTVGKDVLRTVHLCTSNDRKGHSHDCITRGTSRTSGPGLYSTTTVVTPPQTTFILHVLRVRCSGITRTGLACA